ncbi:siderophore iron transporter-like protein mirB [Cucurbitaria berberidis CBS 394.84]|uniref:Siderophore iron transporter-like protein mirB n=1 Tax=Cucurbitaria berberidis CBS 394.84 TaxID=1168544 RepID=A0A9P4GH10_9PLEO|nr:siderophore iron transporter-like protein mirB [Cucurbitaria berberidis CBS 394.84]KAF1845005.1 siderophore iron transporter-like protein mirB [Cucurbitaria berberidis CBS 394.84]
MSATIDETDAVRPAAGFGRPSKDLDIEKTPNHLHETNSDGDTKSVESETFQNGVQRVRAITEIWGKKTLITMFIFLYLIEFVAFLQNAIDAALNPYITSSFSRHGLLNVGSIMSTALAGCIPLATSKVIDVWGRVEGFFFMLIVVVVGMALKAGCKNMETYIAGHVLYWAGHIGVLYVTDVMAADITSLKNRMIIFTINGTPRIASTFAGPAIGDLFINHGNWRWAFGAFIIIFIGCCLPAMGVMVYMYRKAKRAGVIHKQRSNRTVLQSVWFYFVQFDITGILLIMFAFCLFLLPFSLVSYAPKGWKTGYIIAMIVLGILLFPVFAIWEAKFAPVQFLPWKYLRNGTIVGSCLLYGVMFVSIFCWNAYFNSYLQVVHRQSITHAGYILNSFSLASSVFSPFVAWFISWSGNFKWTAYAGVPVTLIGTALLIPFRTPSTAPGVLALTQVLVGLGTGIFSTCAQLAVMVHVTHQEIAAITAIWGLFGSFGSSIGNAIGGAMWNNLLPAELLKRLPEEQKANYRAIFGDIVLQMSFLDGTPERDAIVGAYGSVMRKMVITGAVLVPLCFVSIFLWKNVNVKKLEEEGGKQTKGTVF